MSHPKPDPGPGSVVGPTSVPEGGGKDTSSAASAFAHVELPIPRDRLLHLGVGGCYLYLALAATLAHGVMRPPGPPALRTLAWLPLLLSAPAACAAFVLALRRHPGRWAYRLHGLTMAAGVAIGGVGVLLHAAAAGRQQLGLGATFGSPALAPLTFVAVSIVGWIAAWSDEAVVVGRVPDSIARGVAPAVPGRRALLLATVLGFGAVGLVVFADHANAGWLWPELLPPLAASWSIVVVLATLLGYGGERWKLTYVGTMLADVIVGFLGLAVHLSENLAGPPEQLLARMVLHAPLAAPLVFGLLGMLGLLAIAEPAREVGELEAVWPPRRRRLRTR